MLALPEPARGGSIADLRRFLNVAKPADNADDADDPPGFVLAVAWLLAAFRAIGPYPVLILAGEHGSAKSIDACHMPAAHDSAVLLSAGVARNALAENLTKPNIGDRA